MVGLWTYCRDWLTNQPTDLLTNHGTDWEAKSWRVLPFGMYRRVVGWKLTGFRRNMPLLSSGSKNKLGKKPAWIRQQAQLGSCVTYSSTLKMEATCSSETSVNFQRTTPRYVPEDRTLCPFLFLHPICLGSYSFTCEDVCRMWSWKNRFRDFDGFTRFELRYSSTNYKPFKDWIPPE
jgi:hypothetical protein